MSDPVVPSAPASASAPGADFVSGPGKEAPAPTGDPKVSLKETIAAESKPVETPAEKRSRKLKINDVEMDVTEDEAYSSYQLRRASDAKFQEAAKLRKEAEEVIHLLKTNPRAALEHPAIKADTRRMAEEILNEVLEEELLSPTEKELRDLKRTLASKEAKEKADAAKVEQDKLTAYEKTYLDTAQKDILDTLAKSGLPQTNRTVNRMIYYMQNALKANHELKASDVIDLVREDYQSDIKDIFGAADGSTIASLLGEDGLKKVRTYDIGRLKDPKVPVPADRQPEAKVAEGTPRKTLKEIMDGIK